jgi:hypothetical protein
MSARHLATGLVVVALGATAGCITIPERDPSQRYAVMQRMEHDLGCNEVDALRMMGDETKPKVGSTDTESVWALEACGKKASYVVHCSQVGGLKSSPWKCNARSEGAAADVEGAP